MKLPLFRPSRHTAAGGRSDVTSTAIATPSPPSLSTSPWSTQHSRNPRRSSNPTCQNVTSSATETTRRAIAGRTGRRSTSPSSSTVSCDATRLIVAYLWLCHRRGVSMSFLCGAPAQLERSAHPTEWLIGLVAQRSRVLSLEWRQVKRGLPSRAVAQPAYPPGPARPRRREHVRVRDSVRTASDPQALQ